MVLAIVAVLLVLSIAGAVLTYRRRIPSGAYHGTLRGALAIGSVLGIFMGLSVGFATLLAVLTIRALR